MKPLPITINDEVYKRLNDIKDLRHDAGEAVRRSKDAEETANDANHRSDITNKRLNEALKEGNQLAEVQAGRVNGVTGEVFETLPDRLDVDYGFTTTKITKNQQDIESRGYDIRWGALDAIDGDWGLAINKINNYLVSKGGGVILLPKVGVFTYMTDINISESISFTGLGGSLKASARNVSINFAGSNLIDGVVFDANKTTGRTIFFNGPKIHIKDSVIKDVYGDETTENTVGIYIHRSAHECIVENCDFDGFAAYENGIEADYIGAIRPLWVTAKRVIVKGNRFKGLVGYEDGDYVYVSSGVVQTSAYPFNKSPLVEGYFEELYTVIQNNTFYNSTKSAIKLQASACLVKGNTIINDGVDVRTPIRGYSCIGNIIEDNTIYLTSAVIMSSVFQFQYTKNTIIKDNILHTDLELDNSLVTTVDLINGVDLLFANNELNMRNYNADNIFYLSGARRVSLNHNKVKAKDVKQTYTFNQDAVDIFTSKANEFQYEKTNFPLIIASNGDGVKNVNFEENTFTIGELLASGSQFFGFRNVTNLNFINNHIDIYKNGQTIQLLFENCKQVNVLRNLMDVRVVVADGCDDVKIMHNDFKEEVLSAVYVNNETGTAPKNVRVVGNTVKKCTYLVSLNGDKSKSNVEVIENVVFNWATEQHHIVYIDTVGQPIQRMDQIYVRGNTPSRRFDYGYTSERPSYRKAVGYRYFDWSLGYEVTWSGTYWTNSIGEAV